MDSSNLELSLISYKFAIRNALDLESLAFKALYRLYNSGQIYDTQFSRIKLKQKFIPKFAFINRVKKNIAMCNVHANKKVCVSVCKFR